MPLSFWWLHLQWVFKHLASDVIRCTQHDSAGEKVNGPVSIKPDSSNDIERDYVNGFKCNATGSTSVVPVVTSKVPLQCDADPACTE